MAGQPPFERRIPVEKRRRAVGWAFLFTASAMIFIFSFYPMVSALITSFKTGSSANMKWADPWYNNYLRMFKDKTFIMSLKNTFLYLIIQVPVMLVLAMLLAQLLNNPNLKCRGLFRTCIFLPCAISLVSYSLVFRTLFYDTGMINTILMKFGIIHENIKWLGQTNTARGVNYFCAHLALDGLQHGLLSGRASESGLLRI